jgi:Uma2 family endonuclease
VRAAFLCFAEAPMSVTAKPMPAAAPRDPAVPDVPIYRLSVEQYHAMAEAGILTEDDPVELIEGWLVQKMTKHPPHTLATRRTRRALERLAPTGWIVDTQAPVTTADSEPEPDVAVFRGDDADYADRNPGPTDVALVVEVADTSLRTDQGNKKRLYARADIPIYWIVNLVERQIEVYTDPTGPAEKPDYSQRRDYGPADTIPLVLDSIEVGSLKVVDFLP